MILSQCLFGRYVFWSEGKSTQVESVKSRSLRWLKDKYGAAHRNVPITGAISGRPPGRISRGLKHLLQPTWFGRLDIMGWGNATSVRVSQLYGILKRKLGIIAGYLKVLQELPVSRNLFILCSGVTTKNLVCNISHLLKFSLYCRLFKFVRFISSCGGGGKVVF